GSATMQDDPAIDDDGVGTRTMTYGDELVHGIDARHQFGGLSRADDDIGALSGFETADEMRQSGRLRAAKRHHLEDIFRDDRMPCSAGELQCEKAGVAGRALPR